MTNPIEAVATIDAAAFHRTAFAFAKNDHRPNIRGVCVQPAHAGGCFVVATDGYVLSCAHDVTGTVSETVLVSPPTALLSAIRKLVRRVEPNECPADDEPYVRLRIWRPQGDQTQVELYTSRADIRIDTPMFVCDAVRADDFTYPNWLRAVPAATPTGDGPHLKDAVGTTTTWFDVANLEQLRKGLAVGAGNVVVSLANTGPKNGVLVTCATLEHWFGVIMPMSEGPPWEARHQRYAAIYEAAAEGLMPT